MRRRQVLAAAVALLPTAGCLGLAPGGRVESGGGASLDMAAELPTARLSMETATDADVARELTNHGLTDDERAALDRILDGEETTDWYEEPPIYDTVPVLHEGTVYRLSMSVADSKPATNFAVVIDIPDRTPAEGEAVQFADLPAADRETFADRGFDDGGFVGFGTVLTYTPDEVDESALVPDSEYRYIRWDDGTTASWAVDDGWETELKRYRYTAEALGSASEYGGRIRERYAFELSGLSEAEREIVRTAIEDDHGYAVATDATPSPAFESLVDRFRPREEVAVHDEPDPDVSGRYLVRYDGSVYWTGLRLTPDEDSGSTPTGASETATPDDEASGTPAGDGASGTPTGEGVVDDD